MQGAGHPFARARKLETAGRLQVLKDQLMQEKKRATELLGDGKMQREELANLPTEAKRDGARRGKGKGVVAGAVGNLLPEQQQMQQRKLGAAEEAAALLRRHWEAVDAEKLAAEVELAAALAETEAEGAPDRL